MKHKKRIPIVVLGPNQMFGELEVIQKSKNRITQAECS